MLNEQIPIPRERYSEIINEIWDLQGIDDPLADLAASAHARWNGGPKPQIVPALEARLQRLVDEVDTIPTVELGAWLRYASKYKSSSPAWRTLLEVTRAKGVERGNTPEQMQSFTRGLDRDL